MQEEENLELEYLCTTFRFAKMHIEKRSIEVENLITEDEKDKIMDNLYHVGIVQFSLLL